MVQQLSEQHPAPARSPALPRASKRPKVSASQVLRWRFGAAAVIACAPALVLMTLNSGAESDAALEADAAAFRAALPRPEPPLVRAPQSAGGKSAKLEIAPAAKPADIKLLLANMPARFAGGATGRPIFTREEASFWTSSLAAPAPRTAAAEPKQMDRTEPRNQARVAAEPDATGSVPSTTGPLRKPFVAGNGDQAAGGSEIASEGAPTQCLPQDLQAVLADLKARFGDVTIVSTTHLHTANHSSGGARYRIHLACRAVDFKTQKPVSEVLAYLRTRPELAGVNSYRNGVIHMDVNPRSGEARLGNAQRTSLE